MNFESVLCPPNTLPLDYEGVCVSGTLLGREIRCVSDGVFRTVALFKKFALGLLP